MYINENIDLKCLICLSLFFYIGFFEMALKKIVLKTLILIYLSIFSVGNFLVIQIKRFRTIGQ